MCKKLIGTIAFLFLFVSLVSAQLVVKNSNNSELMRVTPDGLMGIATSLPGARLEVNSKTSNVSGLRFTQLTSASATSPSNSKVLTVNANGDVILAPESVTAADGNNYTTAISFSGVDSKTLTLSRSGLTNLTAIFTDDDIPDNDAEVLDAISINNGRLYAPAGAGFVGIGTSVPAVRLEVDAGAANSSGLRFTRLTSASAPGAANNLALSVDGVGNVILTTNIPPAGDNLGNHIATQNLQMNGWWVSNDGGNEGVWIDNVGRVGIGASIPTTDLHIQNNVPKLPIPELLIEHTGASLAALSYKNQGQIVTSGIDPGDINGYKITALSGFASNAYSDAATMMRIQTAQQIFGILDVNHQSRADGWLSIMFPAPPAWAQIPFDQKLYDEHNEFNTVQPFAFVALQEGYYQVEARTELLTHEMQMPAWPPGAYVEIAIYLNMQPFAYGNKLALTDAAGVPLFHNNAPIVTRVVYLIPGNSVSIWVFHTLPQPVPLMPGQANTYVSIHKIS